MSSFNVKFQDQAIESVSKFIYLGITLDENLNWKEHVDVVCIKANKCLSYWPELDHVSISRHLNVSVIV